MNATSGMWDGYNFGVLKGVSLSASRRVSVLCASCGVQFDDFAPERAEPECVACAMICELWEAMCAMLFALVNRRALAFVKAQRTAWDRGDRCVHVMRTGHGVRRRVEHPRLFVAHYVMDTWSRGARVEGVPEGVSQCIWLVRGMLHENSLDFRDRHADDYTLHVLAVLRILWRDIYARRAAAIKARSARRGPTLTRWESSIRVPASALGAQPAESPPFRLWIRDF